MSYGGEKSNALVTPPKYQTKQLRVASTRVPDHVPSSKNSSKPLLHRIEAPFTPIKTVPECDDDFEPLPFRGNLFEGSHSPNDAMNNHLLQLVYSPVQASTRTDQREAGSEGGEQKRNEGRHLAPIDFNKMSEITRNLDSKSSDVNDGPQFQQDEVKCSEEKPPPYPHHQWPMYPPPPYVWYHHYHYGYHQYGAQDDQTNPRKTHPTLYPKPHNGHYHHAYRPSLPYGHFGKLLFAAGHPRPAEYITGATKNDVICGRGGAVNNHPGNRRFRQFIQEFKHQYLNETKQKKPLVAMRVLDAVKNTNPPGRFLVKYPAGYLEASDDRAREKASQALREGAAKLRKEGYGVKNGEGEQSIAEKCTNGKRALFLKKVLLPNERAFDQSYSDDPEYSSEFDPPRKKIKPEAV